MRLVILYDMATEVIEKLGEHGLLEVYKSIKASVREDCGEYFRDLPGNNELEPANVSQPCINVLSGFFLCGFLERVLAPGHMK